jgi:hypothetical protein
VVEAGEGEQMEALPPARASVSEKRASRSTDADDDTEDLLADLDVGVDPDPD